MALSARNAFFEELLDLLRELLKGNPEALKLAERLLQAYGERGVRGLREELRALTEEATGHGSKDQED
jgi:hypothetical protein